jgi:hypothetical protein
MGIDEGPASVRRRWRALAAGLLVGLSLSLSLTACGADPPAQPGPPSASATASSLRIDWAQPNRTALPDGWRLTRCPGDAPLFCVDQGGRTVGSVEVLEYPLSTLPDLATVLADRGEAAALEDHAERYVADFTAERTETCPPGYAVAGDPPRRLSAVDGLAVRYGFTGTLADGRPSEKTVQYAGLREDTLVLLSAIAEDPGGCVPPEGTSFTSAQLGAFAPILDRIVEASGLPRAG